MGAFTTSIRLQLLWWEPTRDPRITMYIANKIKYSIFVQHWRSARKYRAPESTARRLARSGSTSTGHRCYGHSQTKERTNQKVSTGPIGLQWTNNCSSEGIGGSNVNASEGLIIVSSLVLNGTHHQYHGYLGEQWECDEMVLMMWLE